MRNLLPALFVVFVFSYIATAQTPTPTATPLPATTSDDVVKISTSLIQLDVTVTDKKGQPVRDLRRDEIEIYENGKKQDLNGFSFVDGTQSSATAKPFIQGDRKKPTFIPVPGSQRPEKVRRTIALVVDDLSLSFESVHWVREALKKFVIEQMQDGDLVAIIRTGGGIGALQQFTMDRNQLLAAADKVKFNMGGVKASSSEPIRQTLKQAMNGVKDSQGNTSNYSEDIEREREFERDVNEFRSNTFTQGTLGALNFIIRGMSELPGRKSVVLLSDGIRLFVRDSKGNPELSDSYGVIRKMIDSANRASVVFYTLDARGLVAPGPTAADEITDVFDSTTIAQMNDRDNELTDTQDGLRFIAKGTGGLAYINQNDISKGIEKVLDDQSYYLVAYEPDGDTFDPKTRKFNKIEVRVKRPGAQIRYRSGFFGFSEEQLAKAKPVGSTSLFAALSSPFSANDIQVRFNPVFMAGAKESLFVRSYLHLDPANITFTKQADGNYLANFEIAGVSLGDNGIPTQSSAKAYKLTLTPAVYEKLKTKGIVYQHIYEVKKPGPFQYRVSVRDVASNKVGSANQFVNVPNLKKDRLALSGIIFENASKNNEDGSVRTSTDPIRDTALRQFRKGSVVRYGLEIYNAKVDPKFPVGLDSQVRIFRDGQSIYDGPVIPVKIGAGGLDTSISTTGLIKIGDGMEFGEYVIQIVITDKNVKGRSATTTQFVTIDVVDQEN